MFSELVFLNMFLSLTSYDQVLYFKEADAFKGISRFLQLRESGV